MKKRKFGQKESEESVDGSMMEVTTPTIEPVNPLLREEMLKEIMKWLPLRDVYNLLFLSKGINTKVIVLLQFYLPIPFVSKKYFINTKTILEQNEGNNDAASTAIDTAKSLYYHAYQLLVVYLNNQLHKDLNTVSNETLILRTGTLGSDYPKYMFMLLQPSEISNQTNQTTEIYHTPLAILTFEADSDSKFGFKILFEEIKDNKKLEKRYLSMDKKSFWAYQRAHKGKKISLLDIIEKENFKIRDGENFTQVCLKNLTDENSSSYKKTDVAAFLKQDSSQNVIFTLGSIKVRSYRDRSCPQSNEVESSSSLTSKPLADDVKNFAVFFKAGNKTDFSVAEIEDVVEKFKKYQIFMSAKDTRSFVVNQIEPAPVTKKKAQKQKHSLQSGLANNLSISNPQSLPQSNTNAPLLKPAAANIAFSLSPMPSINSGFGSNLPNQTNAIDVDEVLSTLLGHDSEENEEIFRL